MATAISIAEAQDAVGGAVRRWGIEGRVLGSQVPAVGGCAMRTECVRGFPGARLCAGRSICPGEVQFLPDLWCHAHRNAAARVQHMAGASTRSGLVLRSIVVAVLLSQVAALPCTRRGLVCEAILNPSSPRLFLNALNAGAALRNPCGAFALALTMRSHSSCPWMCWRSLCWTSPPLRLCRRLSRYMERPRGDEYASRRSLSERWAQSDEFTGSRSSRRPWRTRVQAPLESRECRSPACEPLGAGRSMQWAGTRAREGRRRMQPSGLHNTRCKLPGCCQALTQT
jgi:hypothetical protein